MPRASALLPLLQYLLHHTFIHYLSRNFLHKGSICIVVRIKFLDLHLAFLPTHDVSVLSLSAEDTKPLLIQYLAIPFLLNTCLVTICKSATFIIVMLHIQCHAIAAHHGAVRLDVGTHEVVVFFDRNEPLRESRTKQSPK